LPAPCRCGPRVEIGIEQFDDVFDRQHRRGEPRGLFLILQELAANVSVQPNEIRDGGMIGSSFESVRPGYC
jgi:hypothetical protein